MIRHLLLPVITISTLTTFAHGQSPDPSAPGVEFRVTRFDPADRPPPEFEVGSGAGRVAIEVPLTYIGGPHTATLRDGRFLDFWRGEDAARPEISVPIAENARENLLLFFLPDGDSYRVLKIQTPPEAIRGGDRYMLNATNGRLAVRLGDAQPVLIDPGKSGVIRGPGGDDTVSVPVLVSRQQGETWEPASTENWHIDPRVRSYLFAYISPRTRHLAFHVVTERL